MKKTTSAKTPSATEAITHRWTRIAPVKWEDAWMERLRFLGPERVAFITWPESRSMRIEAYCDAGMAARLVREFGGRSARLAQNVWSGNPSAPRGPIAIRGRLKVFSDEGGWKAWGAREPRGILIPAGMAFGTGEHATTATCLRLLCDWDPQPGFVAADLGTGTGILAIAADALGAKRVEALDNDPAATRIAQRNARLNHCRVVRVSQGSVLEWAPTESFDVITANLFSELLIAAAPGIIRSLNPRGALIFSGVLRRQADEVHAALTNQGLVMERWIHRGKWSAGLARRTMVTRRKSARGGT